MSKFLKLSTSSFIIFLSISILLFWYKTFIVGHYYLAAGFFMSGLGLLSFPLILFGTIYLIVSIWKVK